MAIPLAQVRQTIETLLGAGECEPLAPAAGPVRRLALALDPSAGPFDGFDAVVLHRGRGFDAPPGLGVLGCHDPFDQRLGLAENPWLHARLGLRDGAALAPKATVHAAPADLAERVTRVFGGREGLRNGGAAPSGRAVLADALRPELVHAAAGAGASLYVTGTWRVPAAAAIDATGMSVLLVGHARQERWSLRLLAELLAPRLPGVEVVSVDGRT